MTAVAIASPPFAPLNKCIAIIKEMVALKPGNRRLMNVLKTTWHNTAASEWNKKEATACLQQEL